MPQYSDYIYFGDNLETFDYFHQQVQDILGVDLKFFDSFEAMDMYFQEQEGQFFSVVFYEKSKSLSKDLSQLKKLVQHGKDTLLILIGNDLSRLRNNLILRLVSQIPLVRVRMRMFLNRLENTSGYILRRQRRLKNLKQQAHLFLK